MFVYHKKQLDYARFYRSNMTNFYAAEAAKKKGTSGGADPRHSESNKEESKGKKGSAKKGKKTRPVPSDAPAIAEPDE